MYEQVTSCLGKLKPAMPSPIDGYPCYDELTSDFMQKMYDVVPNEGKDYCEVLAKLGMDFGDDYSKVHVSDLDGS